MSNNLRGLLFVGDPHLSSRRPGRRTDKDFGGTVLDKLAQAMTIARANMWQPIILGDLFDRGGENDLSVLTRLTRLLRMHMEMGGAVPLCLVGNHDLRDTDLADDTAMALLRETGRIHILETLEKPDVVTVPGIAHILPVSYGKNREALSAAAKACKAAESDLPSATLPVIALTHEDFDFQGAYPGAAIMTEIPGVDMVVNGHMHKPAPWVRRGQTLWCNPGNITRMSIDCEEFPPSVWSWVPDMDTAGGELSGLDRHVLVYDKAVFDHTGMRVKADTDALRESLEGDMPDAASPMIEGSAFAEMLKNHQFGAVTEDATILQEELDLVMQEKKTDDITSGILHSMMKDVVEAATA